MHKKYTVLFFRKGDFMFCVNDTVVYGSNGVCKITDITDRPVAGKTSKYYELTPVYMNNSTFLVPVENENLTAKMLSLLSESEVKSLLDSVKNADTFWIDNDNERVKKCREIISGCDHAQLLSLIKSLYVHKKEKADAGKKFHIVDERLLKDATKLLFDEFAFVLGITPEEVTTDFLSRM